jgi:hypothetical protein
MRTTPDLLPVLSRGRHRTPRRGACFMEYASYLAGEKWSDHPSCTDPALASLARMVNDCTSDAACDDLLEGFGDSASSTSRAMIRRALDDTPGASSWAVEFLTAAGPLNPRSTPLMSDAIIRTAVVGIADACVSDPDDRLCELLTQAIAEFDVDSSCDVDRSIRELQPTP